MLETSALRPQRLLLPDSQAGGVQLRDLKAEDVLALRPLPLRCACLLHRVARRAVAREEIAHAGRHLAGTGELVEELTLGGRLKEPLLLVLSVNLDQGFPQPLQQCHGHGRVVDECPVAARSCDFSPHDDVLVLEDDARLVEDRARARTPRHVEHRLDGGRIGMVTDQLGARPRATHEQQRVDEDGLARPGLAAEDIQSGGKRHHGTFDHRDVAHPQLGQHERNARSALAVRQVVSRRRH
jgi:hypothetical protein